MLVGVIQNDGAARQRRRTVHELPHAVRQIHQDARQNLRNARRQGQHVGVEARAADFAQVQHVAVGQQGALFARKGRRVDGQADFTARQEPNSRLPIYTAARTRRKHAELYAAVRPVRFGGRAHFYIDPPAPAVRLNRQRNRRLRLVIRHKHQFGILFTDGEASRRAVLFLFQRPVVLQAVRQRVPVQRERDGLQDSLGRLHLGHSFRPVRNSSQSA